MANSERMSKVSLLINGKVVTKPELISRFGGTKILGVSIENTRLSGVVDRFVVHFPNTLGAVLYEGMYIEIKGDIRTVNTKDDERVVYPYIMAKEIKILPGEPEQYLNSVEIIDAELKDFEGVRPSYSDGGRTLATYHIKVCRGHNRNSYFRVTTWGRDAAFIGNLHDSFDYIHLKCRLQSHYSKDGQHLRFNLVSHYLEVPESEELVNKGEEAGDVSLNAEPAEEVPAVQEAKLVDKVGAEAEVKSEDAANEGPENKD